MPLVVDNNFQNDNYNIRAERLNAIQGNLESFQPVLNAPPAIVTWAEDCYDNFTQKLTDAGVEMNESEGASLDVETKAALMEEEYQNAKILANSIYREDPVHLKDFGFDSAFPDRRNDKIARVNKVLEVNTRHETALLTTLVPDAIITRLTNAKTAYEAALQVQDKERTDARHAVAELSKHFENDTKKLQDLRAWAYAMLGKQDPRMGLIGMVNPGTGGGSNVPDAPSNITFYFPSTTFTISEVPGATSYILQASIDDGVTYFDVGSSPNPEIVYVPVQSGWMKYRAAARSSAGISSYSQEFRIGYYPGTVLPAPENLTLQLAAGSPNTLELKWDPTPAASSYSVNRSIVALGAAGPGPFSFVTNTHDPEYVETVIPGNRFYYNLTASNSSQWSGVSVNVFIDVPA